MAVKPKIVTLTNSSVDILNAIRNSASTNYQDYVPVATNSAESIREIGAVIMDSPALQNEFVNALVNRIGRVIVTSKMYDNPLAIFKQGILEFGETVEEIFVEIAKAQQFDPDTAASNFAKRDLPDIRSAFHIMNYQKFYKKTIQESQLKQAFLTWDGVTDLIGKIVNTMYTGANYDEFLVTKYLLARHILNGQLYPQTIPAVETANMKTIVSTIKEISNDMVFMKQKYNLAKVHTHTEKKDQYILMNTKFDAKVDVEVLATAFNMDKAEFMGKRVLVDSFGSLDIERLDELFADDSTYVHLTTEQLAALDTIPAVLVDKDFFMIFDNFISFASDYFGEGLYWNYWYHAWKTFSVSPFANSVVFIPATPDVVSIALTPATANVLKGSTLQLSCAVTTANFAPQTVTYSVDKPTKATVNASGLVTILDTAVDGEAIVVTATSTFDGTITDTTTITVGEAVAVEPTPVTGVVTSVVAVPNGIPTATVALSDVSKTMVDGSVISFVPEGTQNVAVVFKVGASNTLTIVTGTGLFGGTYTSALVPLVGGGYATLTLNYTKTY